MRSDPFFERHTNALSASPRTLSQCKIESCQVTGVKPRGGGSSGDLLKRRTSRGGGSEKAPARTGSGSMKRHKRTPGRSRISKLLEEGASPCVGCGERREQLAPTEAPQCCPLRGEASSQKQLSRDIPHAQVCWSRLVQLRTVGRNMARDRRTLRIAPATIRGLAMPRIITLIRPVATCPGEPPCPLKRALFLPVTLAMTWRDSPRHDEGRHGLARVTTR